MSDQAFLKLRVGIDKKVGFGRQGNGLMLSIHGVRSLYTRAMSSMHACIDSCIEQSESARVLSYFTGRDMNSQAKLGARAPG